MHRKLDTDIHFETYIMELTMQVSKWGNSLAVRLPKALVDELKLKAGDTLAINSATPGELIVEKHDRKTAFLSAMDAFHWAAPQDYRFDRDEANAR